MAAKPPTTVKPNSNPYGNLSSNSVRVAQTYGITDSKSYMDTKAKATAAGFGSVESYMKASGTNKAPTLTGSSVPVSAPVYGGGMMIGDKQYSVEAGTDKVAVDASMDRLYGMRADYDAEQERQKQVQAQLEQYQAQIQALENAKRQQSYAALDQARQGTLNALGQEQAGLAPQYNQLRQQAQGQSDAGAKSLREYMAQRGLGSSGADMQANLQVNTALNGRFSELGTAEQSANQDIARRQTEAEQQYNFGKANAEAGLGIESIQQSMNALQQSQNYAQQLKEFDFTKSQAEQGQSNWEKEFAANEQSSAFQQAIAEAGLTGKYNGQTTIEGKQSALQLAIGEYEKKIQAAQAKIIAAQAKNAGKISDLEVAQAQQEYNNLKAKQSLLVAQTNRANRPAASRSGGSSSSGGLTYTQAQNETRKQFDLLSSRVSTELAKGTKAGWLTANELLRNNKDWAEQFDATIYKKMNDETYTLGAGLGQVYY